jgi:hypothetical protein
MRTYASCATGIWPLPGVDQVPCPGAGPSERRHPGPLAALDLRCHRRPWPVRGYLIGGPAVDLRSRSESGGQRPCRAVQNRASDRDGPLTGGRTAGEATRDPRPGSLLISLRIACGRPECVDRMMTRSRPAPPGRRSAWSDRPPPAPAPAAVPPITRSPVARRTVPLRRDGQRPGGGSPGPSASRTSRTGRVSPRGGSGGGGSR